MDEAARARQTEARIAAAETKRGRSRAAILDALGSGDWTDPRSFNVVHVTKAAGVTTPTFYRHFEDLDQAVCAYLARLLPERHGFAERGLTTEDGFEVPQLDQSWKTAVRDELAESHRRHCDEVIKSLEAAEDSDLLHHDALSDRMFLAILRAHRLALEQKMRFPHAGDYGFVEMVTAESLSVAKDRLDLIDETKDVVGQLDTLPPRGRQSDRKYLDNEDETLITYHVCGAVHGQGVWRFKPSQDDFREWLPIENAAAAIVEHLCEKYPTPSIRSESDQDQTST
ncbi:TetR/AcrR family transcriptional regulator [Rhodococcus qingshengii]|uniref:TetR/AcrR family transcriptional regulator n=1 Tax=Rhodococcus TaxID=1827 RepID=UPI000F62398F|nr:MULTISPECIES: TetR/AcrR family transcriptional regulator [Rhodococcus]AZI61891.1 TetR/AcrR family transcriptional regulator [Rhodococcus sp. NJ-530]BDQ20098.1 TetR/AcrR family transcriptional regulator [Rhodococcus qingshengii]